MLLQHIPDHKIFKSMRKEIIGIILFFLVLFTLISLLSYSHEDPSIHHAVTSDNVRNLFGLFGAHISGILIGLFGMGAFWLPIILLFLSIHFFNNHSKNKAVLTITGGILLIISTGSLFSLHQSHYIVLGAGVDTAGIIVGPLKSFLIKYSNAVGCTVILTLILIIGFILATGFSPTNFIKRCLKVFVISAGRINTLFVIWQEQKKKCADV